MRILQIDPARLAQLRNLAHKGYPNETCGLLLGTFSGDRACVRDVREARNVNIERVRDRYELDPRAMLEADQEARQKGLEIIGIWHSHPDHSARPSDFDRDRAWQGWSYLIMGVSAAGVTETRSWCLNSDQEFIEERIES